MFRRNIGWVAQRAPTAKPPGRIVEKPLNRFRRLQSNPGFGFQGLCQSTLHTS
jgi:hypothetical protein